MLERFLSVSAIWRPRRRGYVYRVQFGIKSLLTLAFVAATIAWIASVYMRISMFEAAEHEYLSLSSRYDMGTIADAMTVALASERMFDAQQALPLGDPVVAFDAHLQRVDVLMRRAEAFHESALFGSERAHRLAELDARKVRELYSDLCKRKALQHACRRKKKEERGTF